MSTPDDHGTGPVDTAINVAQLLKQPVGAKRQYELAVDQLALGEDRVARDLHGSIKLTRVGRGLLVTGSATAEVELTCVRCLEEYVAPVTLALEEEFRPSIDVTSGFAVSYPETNAEEEADYFLIGENHVLDLTEPLRQAVWLSLPMMPVCREDCPGIPIAETQEADAAEDAADADPDGVDARLAVLQHLLETPADERETSHPTSRSDRPTDERS